MQSVRLLIIGIAIRLILLLISIILDQYQVKFTDIDYHVFTDAATFVYNGKSPYDRNTYRYTPLLSYMLIPNTLNIYFGKILFIIFDLVIGFLIHHEGYNAALWLYNPLTAIISVRGNAESFVGLLILLCLYFVKRKQTVTAAILFGLACHVKIYPIIYAPTILAYLNNASGSLFTRTKQCFSKKSLKFFLFSSCVFVALLAVFYKLYGYTFVYEAYLYHIIRKDHRHNFSVYFYPLYLSQGQLSEQVLSLAGFFPQFILVGLLGLRFSHSIYDAVFLQTILFVAFNKVITSQYLIWYLCFIPYCMPTLQRFGHQKLVKLISFWGISQIMWLGCAYLLEFKGKSTFMTLWLSSLCFTQSHVYFVMEYIDKLKKPKVKNK